ncbi:DUF4214 domain-containing protein, partial [Vreelandella titanicae]
PEPEPEPEPEPIELANFVDIFTEKGWELPSELLEQLRNTATFVRYPEFDTVLTPIIRLYNGILDRVAEREGLEYWVAQQNAEGSFNDIVQDFMLAEEVSTALQAMGSDNATFVDTLYQAALGRAADESGRDYWVDILESNNGDRSEVARWFVQSQEYINANPPLVNGNKLLAWGVNLEQMEMRSLGFDTGVTADQDDLAETLVRLY